TAGEAVPGALGRLHDAGNDGCGVPRPGEVAAAGDHPHPPYRRPRLQRRRGRREQRRDLPHPRQAVEPRRAPRDGAAGVRHVRDAVLLKPGPLDQEEWHEMREHPRLGWALLQRIEFLRDASVIVLQHQERYDGRGYPAGLKGEQIVLGARLFAVADTYDAITS